MQSSIYDPYDDGAPFGNCFESDVPCFTSSILSDSQIKCGSFSWRLCQNCEDLGGAFSRYLHRIPGEIWPLAWLTNLKVEEEFRGQKLGQKAVAEFINDAKAQGARCAILKIGWSESDWKTQGAKNLHIYTKAGFILLEDENPEKVNESDIMYQMLNDCLASSQPTTSW